MLFASPKKSATEDRVFKQSVCCGTNPHLPNIEIGFGQLVGVFTEYLRYQVLRLRGELCLPVLSRQPFLDPV